MALPTTSQINQEYQKYFHRDASPQDVANVNKNGLGIVSRSFDKIGGGTGTAQQQGAVARSTPVSAQDKLVDMTEDSGDLGTVLARALKAKQNQLQPINARSAKITENINKVDLGDFADQGMSADAQLQAAVDKISMLKGRKDYLTTQKADLDANEAQIVQQVAAAYNSKLQALGLKVQFDQHLADQAFQASEAAKARAFQAAENAKSRAASRASSAATASLAQQMANQAQRQKIQDNASKLISQLDARKITWTSAYTQMKQSYPQLPPMVINTLLQGAYNPATNQNTGYANVTQDVVNNAANHIYDTIDFTYNPGAIGIKPDQLK